MKISDILSLFENNLLDFNFKERWEFSFNILRNNEKITDIKVSDFIENNFDDFEEAIHGAKNDDGSFKKNSSVKIISWKKIKHFFLLKL